MKLFGRKFSEIVIFISSSATNDKTGSLGDDAGIQAPVIFVLRCDGVTVECECAC